MRHPLEVYRRAQRLVRHEFDSFTRVHCPTCPAPCCVRPARIVPLDILLAQSAGWIARRSSTGESDAVSEAARTAVVSLGLTPADQPAEPCEHLGGGGCTFPPDLRPLGCTTYICPIMLEKLDRKRLGRIRRLVKEVRAAHERLVARLTTSGQDLPDESG